jgi:hypothetical protein
MFDEVSESIGSKIKRRTVFASIAYLGIAAAELVKYCHTHQVDHALLAAVWLLGAVGWAYRFRHYGDPSLTKLEIEAPPKD